jgi:hypothetical protein
MAFWDSASIHSNGAKASLLHEQREAPSSDASYTEPEVSRKWHPGTTLAFIVVSCCLLWSGIFAALGLLF